MEALVTTITTTTTAVVLAAAKMTTTELLKGKYNFSSYQNIYFISLYNVTK
jgi:hypothetical protein